LFSVPSDTSWGIGDIGDVRHVTAWLAAAGQTVLQLLPINEMAAGQQSPYSAISAMAIDPIYLNVDEIPEFAAEGGNAVRCRRTSRIGRVRRSSTVQYETIRALKERALRIAVNRFVAEEIRRGTARAHSLPSSSPNRPGGFGSTRCFARSTRTKAGSRGPSGRVGCDSVKSRRLPTRVCALADEVVFRQKSSMAGAFAWNAAHAAAISQGVAPVWRSPVHGRRRQRGCMGAAGSVPARRVARRAAGRHSADTGQDWGMPVMRWGTPSLRTASAGSAIAPDGRPISTTAIASSIAWSVSTTGGRGTAARRLHAAVRA
jgi:hypothetical protein